MIAFNGALTVIVVGLFAAVAYQLGKHRGITIGAARVMNTAIEAIHDSNRKIRQQAENEITANAHVAGQRKAARWQ